MQIKIKKKKISPMLFIFNQSDINLYVKSTILLETYVGDK